MRPCRSHPARVIAAVTIATSLVGPPARVDARSQHDLELAPKSDRSLVLMVPDLADDAIDERLLAAIAAHRDKGARVDVVRYDPDTLVAADIVATSRRRAGEFAARGVLWVDLSDRAQLAIYLYEVDTDRFLGRRIPAADDAPAASVETLANIIASVVAESAAGPVEGLDELDPAAIDPSAAPSDPVDPTGDPPTGDAVIEDDAPPSWPRLWLGLGYAGSTFSSRVRVTNGLALSAAWAPAPGAFVGVRYDLVLPNRIDDRSVVFELRRHPVSIEGGYRFAIGRRRRADLEGSGRISIDPIVRLSDARASDRPVTRKSVRVFSSVATGFGVGFSPIAAIRLGVRVGIELVTARARYVIAAEPDDIAVDPHLVRALFEAGLQFGLIRRPHAPGRAARAAPDKK